MSSQQVRAPRTPSSAHPPRTTRTVFAPTKQAQLLPSTDTPPRLLQPSRGDGVTLLPRAEAGGMGQIQG